MRILVSLLGLAAASLGMLWLYQQWQYQQASDAGNYTLAAQVWPENPAPWRELAEATMSTDSLSAEREAQTAVRDDEHDWHNWATLSETEYLRGDLTGARDSMARIAQQGNSYEARWRYANLLLLSGDMNGFWAQAEHALANAPGDHLPDMVNECLLVANGDAKTVEHAMTTAMQMATDPGQAMALSSSIFGYMLDADDAAGQALWWPRMLRAFARAPDQGVAQGVPTVGYEYLARLLSRGDAEGGLSAWQSGVAAGLFAASDGPTAADVVSDGDFSQPADSTPLQWTLCSACKEVIAPRNQGGRPGLGVEFQANDSGPSPLATQTLLLRPNQTYRLQFAYSTDYESDRQEFGTIDNPGIAVEIMQTAPPAPTGTPIALWKAGAEGDGDAAVTFKTPAAAAVYQLIVEYARPMGEMSLSGRAWFSRFSVRPDAGADTGSGATSTHSH